MHKDALSPEKKIQKKPIRPTTCLPSSILVSYRFLAWWQVSGRFSLLTNFQLKKIEKILNVMQKFLMYD